MITVFFHSLLFLFISYSHGIIFIKKLLKSNTDYNFFEISLIGLMVTLIFSPLINFFIPLNDNLIISNIFLLIIYSFFNKKIFYRNIKVNYKISLFVFLLVIANIYGSGFSDDLDHYHYGFIINSDEMNLIWGNSFLHPLYGTSPIWLTGHSYFNFDYSRLIDIHIFNGLILFLILSLFLTELNSYKKRSVLFNKLLFALLMFILIKYTRLKEFGIDRPSILLFCFLIYYYFKFFLTSGNNDQLNNFVILVLISITIISIKIIYLPIMIIPFLVLIQLKKKLLNISYYYVFIFFPIFIFLFKNLFSTGCLIFPFEFTCLKFLSWSNHLGSNEFSFFSEVFNKSWTSYSGVLSERDYIKDFNWFTTWFNRGKIEIFEYFLLIIFISFFTNFLIKDQFKIEKKYISNLKTFKIALIIIILFSIFIYIFKNPVIRMNHHILISLLVLSLFLVFKFNKKTKKKTILLFITIGLLFNLSKNIIRISNNDFINDPQLMISQKINPQEKKTLGSFTYYMGWYGNSPIGNQYIDNNNYRRILIFDIIER